MEFPPLLGRVPLRSGSVAFIAAQRRSCTLRRPASALACLATRRATPWSQLATESALRTEPALRASTRNVAWKASWASCGLSRTFRQTPRTIDPWRSTKAAKAAYRPRPAR